MHVFYMSIYIYKKLFSYVIHWNLYEQNTSFKFIDL